MSERGIVLSEIVAQLVADARRQEGLSMDELADRAGVHRTYIGLLERRSRQPTLAVAANLAEALGLSLSELVAEAEHDVGQGTAPEVELLPARRRRQAEQTRMGRGVQLTAMTGLTTGMTARAIELAYRKLDLVDDQIRESGSSALAGLIDLPELSALTTNVLSSGIARASNGLYVQSRPDHSPSLLPLRHGLPELEVLTALETDRPACKPANGVYLTFRYVLANRDGSFTRGKESRGDTVAVWEVRFGELTVNSFHLSASRNGDGEARMKKEALEAMELIYYDPELLPYARPTGVYARLR
jgi:transcriptional regulator with XRE-family HTH domain